MKQEFQVKNHIPLFKVIKAKHYKSIRDSESLTDQN